MQLTIYQVDAFASKPFEGNPAAICPLESWLPDVVMQSIAMENNLSETAYFVATDRGFHIRWFTPLHEVDLCGHATLASAHVLFNILGYDKERIIFESRSGDLAVKKKGDWLEMDFPAQPPTECGTPVEIVKAFEDIPLACLQAADYIVVFEDEEKIVSAKPDLHLLSKLGLRGVAITAPGKEYDFVTRFFAPRYGINEDPVTGSAFTQLIPYWAERLGKTNLLAKQVSTRGGEVRGRLTGDRVTIAGKAASYMKGTIVIP